MAVFKMLITVFMMASFMILHVIGAGQANVEPTCYSRFDYDYKLMQKLSELENKQKLLNDQLVQQTKVIDNLQKELQDSVQTQWREWTTWSKCTFSCTGQDGGRLQTRDRTRSTTSGDTQSETESRPCNAVQFAGCINQTGSDDNFAIAYDYADQVAVAACTAMHDAGHRHVYAVRRQCSAITVECDEICKNLKLTCFNSLHVYSPTHAPALARDATGMKSVYTYRYNGCRGGCGPNFCCCTGP